MTFRSPFKSGPALASRLCKAAMLSRFNLVAKEAQREELLAAVSYREAKVRFYRSRYVKYNSFSTSAIMTCLTAVLSFIYLIKKLQF